MLLRTQNVTIGLFVAIAGFGTASCADQEAPAAAGLSPEVFNSANPVRTEVFESEPFVIDRIYRSMEGPSNVSSISLGDPAANELVWVLSYETEIVDTAEGQGLSAEFMCHNNVDFPNVVKHRKLIGADRLRTANRIITLSQGMMNLEFPDGFGIPIWSGEPILLNTQVLNLNPIEEKIEVRYRTTVRYVLESERVEEIKALYQHGLMVLKLLQGPQGYPGITNPDPTVHGESCSVGEVVDGGREIEKDGHTYANHWVVEPGREENHTNVTPRLGLEGDATVHYIAVHMHPFAESLELRDLTANKTVFKSRAINHKGRIGLKSVQSYSSSEGMKLFKDHQYALISVYQNDSGVPQDAMASMFLYLSDTAYNRSREAGRQL